MQIFQQLMQERITIRFRPGLELRLFPNPRHSQVDSDREKHGKHMGKTMKKTTCSIYFDTTSCNFRPSQSCHTIFSVFLPENLFLPSPSQASPTKSQRLRSWKWRILNVSGSMCEAGSQSLRWDYPAVSSNVSGKSSNGSV